MYGKNMDCIGATTEAEVIIINNICSLKPFLTTQLDIRSSSSNFSAVTFVLDTWLLCYSHCQDFVVKFNSLIFK